MNETPKKRRQTSFGRAFAIAAAGFLALAGASYLGLKAWSPKPAASETLHVGYLPVTCHLTCPVTDFASKTSRANKFVSMRFQDFPTAAEAFKTERIGASFFIAPLAMKLIEQGVAAKIVYLGHRDGSTIMVRKESDIHDLEGLKGKKVAFPSRYSNQYLVLVKLLKDRGLTTKDFEMVELPPPEMPSALAAKAIDAYFIGEPHAARAELNGTGRILYHAKDIWPGFISCVLVVSQKLIDTKPELVADLVRGIAESGEWIEGNRLEAAKIGAEYFKQSEEVVRYVLTHPPDRVSYATLVPKKEEIEQIRDRAFDAGLLQTRVNIDNLLDLRFIPAKFLR